MPNSGPPGAGVRRTPAYRAAVWCDRVAFASLLFWWIAVCSGHGRPLIGFGGFLGWTAAVLAVSSLVLLRLAGVRFTYRFVPFGIADKEVSGQYLRDLFWLPPR